MFQNVHCLWLSHTPWYYDGNNKDSKSEDVVLIRKRLGMATKAHAAERSSVSVGPEA